MNSVDILLLLLLGLALWLALRKICRDRKQGRSCHGNCADCRRSCSGK